MGIIVKKIETNNFIIDYELGYLAGKLKAETDFNKNVKKNIKLGTIDYDLGYKKGYDNTYKTLEKNKLSEDGLTKLIKNNLMNNYV